MNENNFVLDMFFFHHLLGCIKLESPVRIMMNWTERDEAVWEEILKWEQTLLEYEGNDLQTTYIKWLERTFASFPEEWQEAFLTKLDQWMFQVQSLLQGSQIQEEARERILVSARAFDDSVVDIPDLRKLTIDQLHYLNRQHSARHRLYSFIQGGMTGKGGFLSAVSDFPILIAINVRAVQLTAMTYGFDVQSPYETMISLKVFHAAVLPKQVQIYGWKKLLEDLENKQDVYFYDDSEQLADPLWLNEIVKQLMKLMAINMFKKKQNDKFPLIRMAIGANFNYQFTKKVTEYAEKYYQYRLLLDKKGDMK